MCGRFNLTAPIEEIIETFHLDNIDSQFYQHLSPRFNIAPNQEIAIIRSEDSKNILSFARWGLIPDWSKEPKIKYSTINARAETVDQKPTYREAFKRKRCLIPANGFYEWKKSGNKKIPHHIFMRNNPVFAFAGLWDHWENEHQKFDSCTIIVTTANTLMKPIHERMPVIIKTEHYVNWLSPDTRDIKQLLKPFSSELMKSHPVDQYVNSPRHEGLQCIRPIVSE